MSEHNHDEIERQIMTTPLFGQTRNEGRNAMELADLKRHIRTLITLEETNAPVISCYLNLKAALAESGVAGYRSVFDQRVALLRKGMPREDRERFEEAMGRIEAFLATDLLPDSKGAAIFARGGAEPFFLPLQFQAPLPNWIVVDLVPNVYHLVELKDSYHRFVVLLMTEESARILEGVRLPRRQLEDLRLGGIPIHPHLGDRLDVDLSLAFIRQLCEGARAGLLGRRGEIPEGLADPVQRVRGEVHPAERAVSPDASVVHEAVALVDVLAALDRGAIRQVARTAHHSIGDGGNLVPREVASDKEYAHADDERVDSAVAKTLGTHGTQASTSKVWPTLPGGMYTA